MGVFDSVKHSHSCPCSSNFHIGLGKARANAHFKKNKQQCRCVRVRTHRHCCLFFLKIRGILERVTGFKPVTQLWESRMLSLHHTRLGPLTKRIIANSQSKVKHFLLPSRAVARSTWRRQAPPLLYTKCPSCSSIVVAALASAMLVLLVFSILQQPCFPCR